MIQTFKDINAILSFYKVKTFKVTDGEYIAVKKNGIWHYHNWSYKEKAMVKTGESETLNRTKVRNTL